ncbi:MAG TPA: hypothetical protein VLZ30_11705 [Verrucomicrobiae bacterium]|nr:hypothetical protein [Verrucomicrobiae bacterium]
MRLLTTLLVISFTGNLPTLAEGCEPATAQCHGTRTPDCCRPAHCCCNFSAPSQPPSNPKPLRPATNSGRGMAKIASLPAANVFLASGERADARSVSGAGARPSAITPSYLLTHAFLI